MRIGILTQPLHYNYGGIIQNWALQQVLMRMGHEPEMIFLTAHSKPNARLIAMRCLSFAKCIIKKYLLNRSDVYIHSVLKPRYNPSAPQYVDDEFVKRLRKTKPLDVSVDLEKFIDKRRYDAFIVGSDQVWREEYSPNILSFFLNFLPADDTRKRIAYAASFGKEHDYISSEKMPECIRLLSRFDSVSVRETEGISIIQHDFGREQVEKVLDPTLLLSSADYERLIKPNDHHRTPYIASYILDSNNDKSAIIAQIAIEKGLPVNKINIELSSGDMATMSQWLANFADADFVVTDSFHGCVFSIIFGKPFIAIANAERGVGRFVSLLEEFGLTNRLVYSFDDFSTKQQHLLEPLDYSLVHQRHDTLRHHSLTWLKNALEK